MVCDTSSLYSKTATIHRLVTHRVHMQSRRQRQSLILYAQRRLRGRCVGWDESLLMGPKGQNLGPGVVPANSLYYTTSLFHYIIFVRIMTLRKNSFLSGICRVVSGSCKLRTRDLSSCSSTHAGACYHLITYCHECLKTPHLVYNHRKLFLCLITFCVINFT